MEEVILVNEKDEPIGKMEKMEAHEKGLLHRAFSILIFNSKGEMLIQQRAKEKYHSPGLWTNACCSHPRETETTLQAAERRLVEELGFSTEVTEVFSFIYQADTGNNLIENEFDHVFIGYFNDEIPFNTKEVMAVKWIDLQELKKDIQNHSESYTAWFKILMNEHFDAIVEKI